MPNFWETRKACHAVLPNPCKVERHSAQTSAIMSSHIVALRVFPNRGLCSLISMSGLKLPRPHLQQAHRTGTRVPSSNRRAFEDMAAATRAFQLGDRVTVAQTQQLILAQGMRGLCVIEGKARV